VTRIVSVAETFWQCLVEGGSETAGALLRLTEEYMPTGADPIIHPFVSPIYITTLSMAVPFS